MRAIGKALLLAVAMATIYTRLLSLVGYPSWTHHHSFDFLSWIFIVYAVAFYSGLRGRIKL